MLENSEFLSSYLAPSKKYHSHIKKCFQPLQNLLNVTQFYYATVHANGSYTTLESRPDFGEYLLDKEFYTFDPYLRHPKFLQSGIMLWEKIPDTDCTNLNNQVIEDWDWGHSFVILERDINKTTLFGFSGAASEKNMLSLYLNELPVFRRFIDYFLEESQHIIQTMDAESLNLNTVLKENFYQSPFAGKQTLSEDERQCFIRQISKNPLIDIHLTNRERDCLRNLLKGYTAKHTGEELNISPRTVENILYTLKNKLQCVNKSDLFQKAKILEELELLI